jgi:hypothetical protein
MKTITMPLTEYNEEIADAHKDGYIDALRFMESFFHGSKVLRYTEELSPKTLEILYRVQELMVKDLKNGK